MPSVDAPDMAFIRIEMTEQLEELRRRSRALDNTVSPYIIHRKPIRMRRQWTDNKPHWTYINPDYVSKSFENARDSIDRFARMAPGTRPSFHEIRGLGSRLLAEQVVPEKQIQQLMTHSTPKTTKIYLDGGAAALTDDDLVRVSAALCLREILS